MLYRYAQALLYAYSTLRRHLDYILRTGIGGVGRWWGRSWNLSFFFILFRSQVKQSADPQLTVQVGLALTKRTEADLAYMRDINPDSLKFKELDSCVRECGVHGVGRLGTIAQQLIQEATDLAAAKRADACFRVRVAEKASKSARDD